MQAISLKILLLAGAGVLAACSVPKPAPPTGPDVMRWDQVESGPKWTQATMSALETHGAVLPETIPADFASWCPGYVQASPEDRKAFWVGLISTLAKHESTWNQDAVGGNGRWFGLVQISPGTARGYGCKAQSGQALLDGEDNLSCAVRIMAVTVPRDRVISAGMRGVAADWGPFHSDRKRRDMMEWTKSQRYCQLQETTVLDRMAALIR